jgi:hypothetical protein
VSRCSFIQPDVYDIEHLLFALETSEGEILNSLSCSFALHHAVAPWILKMGLGVDFKPKIIITNPFKLLFAMFVSATLPWHALNALVYRPSLQYFYVSQPLILLASLPIDLDNCAWAARAYPKGSAKTFGLLLSYGRVLSSMSTPGATALASHNEVCDGYKDGYCECVHLTIFSYIVIGYLLPCAMLHQLERYAWCAYLDAEPAMLTWQHGPSVDEIRDVVRDLKEEERVPSAELDMSSTSRSWQRLLTAFVVLAVLWQSLEIILYSPLLVQTFAHFRQRHT